MVFVQQSWTPWRGSDQKQPQPSLGQPTFALTHQVTRIQAVSDPFSLAPLASRSAFPGYNSETYPRMRDALAKQGITGKGIGVAVLEVSAGDLHSQMVENTIGHDVIGAAPATNVWVRDINQNTGSYAQLMNEMTQKLYSVLQEAKRFPSTNTRLVNLSLGASPAQWVQSTLARTPANKRTQATYDALIKDLQAERNRPESLAAKAVYQETTKLLASNGISVVVAAGNDGEVPKNLQKMGIQGNPQTLNFLAESPYVIAVGASDGNYTNNGNYSDDKIAGFSSSGLVNSPIENAALGQNVLVADRWGRGYVASGTSFSAPLVAGDIALMLQRNPSLTFSEIKGVLSLNGHDITAGTERDGTGGILDPVQAANVYRLKQDRTKLSLSNAVETMVVSTDPGQYEVTNVSISDRLVLHGKEQDWLQEENTLRNNFLQQQIAFLGSSTFPQGLKIAYTG